MKLTHLTLTIALAVGLGGCSAHTEYHGINVVKALAGDYTETVVLEEEAAVWVGFIESPWLTTDDIARLCPTDQGYVKKYKSFGSGLLQLVTIGIYTSIDVEIGCLAQGAESHHIKLTRDQALAIAATSGFVETMRQIDPELGQAAEVAHFLASVELQELDVETAAAFGTR